MKRLFCFLSNHQVSSSTNSRRSSTVATSSITLANADVKGIHHRGIAGQKSSFLLWGEKEEKPTVRFVYLELLPPELKVEILSFLEPADLCALRAASITWKNIVDDDRIWKALVYRTYAPIDKLDGISWRMYYIQLQSWRWSDRPEDKCKYIKLSDNNRTAADQCAAKESYKWTTVLGTPGISRGRALCEIQITKCCASNVNTIKIAFGLVDKPPKLLYNCPFGYSSGGFSRPEDKNSCCFMADGNFMLCSKSLQTHIGKPWNTGDYVGMLMDFNLGIVQYYLNGEKQGGPLHLPFMKNGTGPLYPAVSLINGNEVKLSRYPKYPIGDFNAMEICTNAPQS